MRSRCRGLLIGEIIQEQTMRKAIPSSNASEENTSGGVFKERDGLQGKEVTAPEAQDIVLYGSTKPDEQRGDQPEDQPDE
jgi:hypothetical protein